MATLVCFHAHPDDEALQTGGLMARASAEGHRVVLVVATDGAQGEVPDDLVETLVERREAEAMRSAEALGIHRVVFLRYADSGMTGWEQNDAPESFWRADIDDAAARLADVLRDEQADVLTIYDWHGGYGHPDHIQVHRVGCRAEELVKADLPDLRVLEATMNRDEMRRGLEMAKQMADQMDGFEFDADGEEFDPDGPMDDGNPMGTPEAELTLGVDVSAFIGAKRTSLAAHRSQVTDTGMLLQMPEEFFTSAFGTEWFIEHDRKPGLRMGWVFED